MTFSAEARSNVRHWVYFLLVFGVMIAQPAYAQVAAGQEVFDATFWFRAVFTALVSVLIFVAKGSDTRLKRVELRVEDFNVIHAERSHTVKNLDGRLIVMEHEQKQLVTLIGMQREMMLTKYHDKEETERHRVHVENCLAKISARLDHFQRPSHRSEDDENRYRNIDNGQ